MNKMNRKHIFLAIALLFVASIQTAATPIAPKVARAKAASFLSNRIQLEETPVLTASEDEGLKGYYVFNSRDDKGFVVISDDESAEVLAYTEQGRFDAASMPEAMSNWLEALRRQPTFKTGARAIEREEVEPLLATSWGQGDPYNIFCPTYLGTRCHTGCVATAMAQVMYYHRWPQYETFEIPEYSPSSLRDYEDFSYDPLPPLTFEWDKMLNTYESNVRGESVDAVAKLMQYCGYASEMNYGRGENASKADDGYLLYALKTYFQYDGAMELIYQSDYSYQGWISRLHEELMAKRPVLLTGREVDGDYNSRGHAFVCDGYKDGMLHINWGYSSGFNGYFKPYSLKASDWDYSYLQKAVVNIQPDNGLNEPWRAVPSCRAIYDDVVAGIQCISCEIWQFGIEPVRFAQGFGDLNLETGEITFLYARDPVTLPEGNVWGKKYNTAIKNMKLHNAKTYHIVPLYCLADGKEAPKDASADWKRLGPYNTHLEVAVDENGLLSFTTSQPTSEIVVDSITFNGPLILEQSASLSACLTNIGEGSYFSNVTSINLHPLDGSRDRKLGQSRLTIMPGESYNFNLTFTPRNTSGKHILYIKDELTGEEIGSTEVFIIDPSGINDVDYTNNKKQPVYTLTGIKADGCNRKGIYVSKGKKIIR